MPITRGSTAVPNMVGAVEGRPNENFLQPELIDGCVDALSAAARRCDASEGKVPSLRNPRTERKMSGEVEGTRRRRAPNKETHSPSKLSPKPFSKRAG